MSDVLLSFTDVSVSFKARFRFGASEKLVLKDVNFSVERGQSIGVLGGNGAGKSTLLALAAGILGPNTGTVRNHNAEVALLSLNLGFDAILSGRINATMSGLLHGLKKAEVARVLEEIKEYSGLGESFEQPLYTYSAGMRARLGFAISQYVSPDVLLIDEVLGVGDQEFRDKSSRSLRERIRREDQAVILVSHNAITLVDLCNRFLFVNEQTVREVSAEELKALQDLASVRRKEAAEAVQEG
ncbi:MAG: ABC transporter ATP-binding protein [Pseudomonadota bacterium]